MDAKWLKCIIRVVDPTYFFQGSILTEEVYLQRSRRILYLQTLLQRDNSELTKKIYQTQKENPLSGDFAELVQNDLSSLSAHLTDSYIESKNKESLKTEIKPLIHQKALKYLFNKHIYK